MTSILFSIVALCWGLTWYAIKLQIGPIPVEISIFYRFTLAAIVLCGFLLITGQWRPLAWKVHPWLILMGIGLFGLNFIFMYSATAYIASGIVAVIFTTSTLLNALASWALYRQKPGIRFFIGAIFGLSGIICLFGNQILTFSHNENAIIGLILVLCGTATFSLGNMVSVKLHKMHVSTPNAVARGMAYGAAMLLIYSLVRGHVPVMPTNGVYIGALFYLAIPGSVIAFVAYLALINRIGAGRAAYVTVIFPVIALSVSTVLEGYHWTSIGIVGLGLILMGNVTIFAKIPTFFSLRKTQRSCP